MLVKNIHTIQTVYVHGPPPPQILQHNNSHTHIQNSVIERRPASVRRISINYSNPPINPNIVTQTSVKPMN